MVIWERSWIGVWLMFIGVSYFCMLLWKCFSHTTLITILWWWPILCLPTLNISFSIFKLHGCPILTMQSWSLKFGMLHLAMLSISRKVSKKNQSISHLWQYFQKEKTIRGKDQRGPSPTWLVITYNLVQLEKNLQ